jgi:hypothetical protein
MVVYHGCAPSCLASMSPTALSHTRLARPSSDAGTRMTPMQLFLAAVGDSSSHDPLSRLPRATIWHIRQ